MTARPGLASRLLLCSASPRRADLLARARIPFARGPAPDVDETPPRGVPAREVALVLAVAKACRAAARSPGRTVLCADTTVVLDGGLLGKPSDAADAARMLRALSGRAHLVVTGVCVARDGRRHAADDATHVVFRALGAAEIAAYVAGGEPFGKAGGYAIQAGAAGFVERLDGDLETVVGLPTRLVRRLTAALDAAPAPAARGPRGRRRGARRVR